MRRAMMGLVLAGCAGEVAERALCFEERAYCERDDAYLLCVSDTTGRQLIVSRRSMADAEAFCVDEESICEPNIDAGDGPWVPLCIR